MWKTLTVGAVRCLLHAAHLAWPHLDDFRVFVCVRACVRVCIRYLQVEILDLPTPEDSEEGVWQIIDEYDKYVVRVQVLVSSRRKSQS